MSTRAPSTRRSISSLETSSLVERAGIRKAEYFGWAKQKFMCGYTGNNSDNSRSVARLEISGGQMPSLAEKYSFIEF